MMPPRLLLLSLLFCLVSPLHAQTAADAVAPDYPVSSELYDLMTDHLGTDTGPESICGVGSVAGRPFSATRVFTSLARDAASQEDPHSYLIARDRFGRVRCEIGYVEPDFGAVRHRVRLGTYIYDPVGQTHISMYPESFRGAFVIPFSLMDPIFAKGSPVFSFCVLAAAEDSYCLNKFRESWKDKVVSSSELGSQTIAGLNASGYIAVLDTSDEHGRKESPSTLEEWVSADDQLLLRESRRNGEAFTRTVAVTNLVMQDPPASLFEIPRDNPVHQVSSLPEQVLDSKTF